MGYCCASGGVLGMTPVGASLIEVEPGAGLAGWGDGNRGGESWDRMGRALGKPSSAASA